MGELPLNDKQEEFCYLYVANNYNAREAYMQAYGRDLNNNASFNNNSRYAYNLLKKKNIQERIAEIRKERLDELKVDADRITTKLAEIAFTEKGDDYYNANAQLKALELLRKTEAAPQEFKINVEVVD